MAYKSKFKSEELDALFEAVMALESGEECYRFFEDICTVNEMRSLAQRWSVAKYLAQKKTYSEIEDITGASTATISRINKALEYGADGYKTILAKLEKGGKL